MRLFRQKSNAEKPSLISTAVRKFWVLTSAYIVAVFAFIWLVQFQLTPSFYADIFGKMETAFRAHESALVTAFLQRDSYKARLVVDDDDFLPVAKKELISRAENQTPNFECVNGLEDVSWGQICKEESTVRALIPVRSADQLLGWLQIEMPAKLSEWTPYARIHQAIVYSAFFLIVLTFLFLMRFLRSTLIPVRRAIQELSGADDIQALRTIGSKLPFRELVGLTTNLVRRSEDLNQTKHALQEAKRREQLSAVASQVAHDLRSPVLALTALSREVHRLSKEDLAKSIETSARRIDQISRDVLEQCEVESNAPVSTYTFIVPVIQTLIAEAKLVNSNVSVSFDHGHFLSSAVGVSESDLSRVLSNLLINSISAIQRRRSGEIEIKLSQDESRVLIQVFDTGEGMTPEVARTVLEKGGSFTPHGHGLGLSYIKTVCNDHGGSLSIESQWLEGTTASLQFPRPLTPSWLANEVLLPRDAKVVVIDDDPTIHDLWQRKLKGFDCRFLFKPEANLNADLFIVDQEIRGYSETGLNFIERTGIQSRAILSTGHSSDSEIQAEVERLGCRLLPKFLAADIPVLIKESSSDLDLVLIDDDIVTRQSWELMAKINGKRLAAFESYESFKSSKVSSDTPIYVDRSLGRGVTGDRVINELRQMGFIRLNLISGDERTRCAKEFPQ